MMHSQYKKRHVIKKQLIRSGWLIVAIVALSSVGFFLSTTLSDADALAFLPAKNDGVLVVWRLSVYGIVIALLTPLVLHRVSLMSVPIERMTKTLLRCRAITAISIALYECFIVQNALKSLIQWGRVYGS